MEEKNHPERSSPPQGSRFPPTRWSLVVSTQDEDSPAAERALAELCEMYWFPLYGFVRGRGYSSQDAEDLTQEFFRRVIEKNYFLTADANRGRLRSFLLGAMKHFLSDARTAAKAQKRGGGRVILSLDQRDAESRYLVEPGHDESPDVLFDKRWARTLLDHILEKLRAVYAERDQANVFEALHPFLAWNSRDTSYREAASRLGMKENAVQVAVFRMRKRYGELLRSQVAETVASPGVVAGELQHVFRILQA
jgi:RNA polymerase sigma-70 factor (ECF subfamily)